MFSIQAKKRLKAVEEKTTNMRELAESTLHSIANDTSDTRQHLAQRELDRRAELDKKKQEEKEKAEERKNFKPDLLTRAKESTKDYFKENSTDIGQAAKEYIKYMF